MISGQSLRPLGIAAIVDEAARLVRRRPSLYYGVSLPVTLPLLWVIIQISQHVTWFQGSVSDYEAILNRWAALASALLVLRFVSHGALCRAFLTDIESGHPDVWQSWRQALARAGALTFGGLALWFICGFGVFMLLIPALIGLALLSGYPYFVMADERSYYQMLLHSLVAVRGQAGRVFLLQTLLAIIALVLAAGLVAAAPFFLTLAQTLAGMDTKVLEAVFSLQNPVYLTTIAAIVILAIEPVRVLAQMRLNLDARIRREGFDLLDRASRMTGRDLRIAAGTLALLSGALSLGAPAMAQDQDRCSLQEAQRRLREALQVVAEQRIEQERSGEFDRRSLRLALRPLEALQVELEGDSMAMSFSARSDWDGIEDKVSEEALSDLASLEARLRLAEEELRPLLPEHADPERLDSLPTEPEPGSSLDPRVEPKNDGSSGSDPKEINSKDGNVKELDAKDIDAEVEAILSKDRYRRRSRHQHDADLNIGFFDSWLQKLSNGLGRISLPKFTWFERFSAWLKNLFSGWSWPKWSAPNINLGAGMGRGSFVIALIVLLAALAFAFAWWLKLRSQATDQVSETISVLRHNITDPIVAYETTEESWRGDARRFAGDGRFDFAVRSSYAGLLLTLNTKGFIEFDKTRTNWEYLRDLRRRRSDLAARMKPLTVTFDEKWYGKKDCSEGDYQSFRQDLDGLLRELDAGGEPRA